MEPQVETAHSREVSAAQRFEFGKNWMRFLESLNEERILTAQQSLAKMLGISSLEGKRFLDAGSGSGLFSLAARRLGAEVTSFDYDPLSVACTRELRRRFFPEDPAWRVLEGSVLDPDWLRSLGQFDVVYSWGVLHHTGSMWGALENVIPLVARGGQLFIAIYNDQGTASTRWKFIKRNYLRTPKLLRFAWEIPLFMGMYWRPMVGDLIRLTPFATFRNYGKGRGMSVWRDFIDWIGGYPFEVARPEVIFDFYRDRGFSLEKMATAGGSVGCNEFVFRRIG
jgi:2-polyprenyl-6-hydroxyphenyl methylase/3-demethylubiquinone-9 3-methyltransferase